MTAINHQFRLAARPVGLPKREDWSYTEEPVREPGEGELLVKVLYISLDPAMRGWMNEGKSYIPPAAIGEVMRAGGAGRVVSSKHPGFVAGDYVIGHFGVQEYALSKGKDVAKVDPRVAPLPVHLGTLGMPGLTAYFGLLDIGKPNPGDTVVVSGAAGAVGTVVGQIAKLKGCRVVGIAGGADKCRHLTEELGFDAAVDHRSADLPAALAAACPDGIDVYFENVGGAVFDAVLPLLNDFARIPVCGLVSAYNATELPPGPDRSPALMRTILTKRLHLQGFIVWDFADQAEAFVRDVGGWLRQGRVKHREDIVEGLENALEAFIGLLKGRNFGKQLVRLV